MAYRHDQDDDDEIPSDDRDDPIASDMDADEDGEATAACPYCGKPVYEDADLCPHCRSFISYSESPRRRPWWVIVGVVACILVVLIWVVSNA